MNEEQPLKIITASNPQAKKLFWTGKGWSSLFKEAKAFSADDNVTAESFLEVIKLHPLLQPHFIVSLKLAVEAADLGDSRQ